MTPRRLAVVRGLACWGLLALGAGCSASSGSGAGPSRVAWNACTFLGANTVGGVFDGGATDGGPVTYPGATDFPWPGPNPDAAWALETAESRCDYAVDLAGAEVDVALAARLSGSDDRSVAGIQDLLVSEGYPPAAAAPPTAFVAPDSCVTAALWASASYGGDADTQRRGELHVLLSTPPAASSGCPPAPGDDRKESLFAYLVLFVTASDLDSASELAVATGLMNAALPAVRSAMSGIAREQREATDAGGDGGSDGGADAAGPDGGPSSLALGDYPGAAAAALCARLDACCSADERAAGNIPSGSTATCTAFVTAAFELALAGTPQSVDSGALTYDAVAAAACVSGYQATSCDVLKQGHVAIPCLTAFTAQTTSGGTCHSDLDCIAGYCRIDASDGGADGGGASTGTCSPAADLGQACDLDTACTSGSCQRNVCAPAVARPWCQGI